MRAPLRLLLLAATFAALMYSDDITIPMDGGGSVVIHDPSFIRHNQFHMDIPELSFTLIDNASKPWKTLAVQFDMGGFCLSDGDRVRQWSTVVDLTPSQKSYLVTIESLRNHLQSCRAELFKAQIVGPSIGHPTFSVQELLEQQAKRYAKEAEQQRLVDEAKRFEAEQRAKKDAAQTARWKQLAEEERKKDAEDSQKLRAGCFLIYKNTIDKKISDLTVRQEQQVRACQALGLYPPQ